MERWTVKSGEKKVGEYYCMKDALRGAGNALAWFDGDVTIIEPDGTVAPFAITLKRRKG
jgi:hypothetical protein